MFLMKRALYLLINLIVFSVSASEYPVVIPTKSVDEPYGVKNIYFKTITTNIGPASEQIVPSGYMVTLWAREEVNYKDIVSFLANGIIADGSHTIGELAMQAYNDAPAEYRSGNKRVHTSPNNCMAWGAAPREDHVDYKLLIAPGGCITAPPSNANCKFITQEVLLDHGSLRLTDGNISSKQISIECSETTDVQFSLPGSDEKYIYLEGQKAEISINEQPLGSKITLPAGVSSVKIQDKLIGNFPVGAYSGSNVIIMNFV